MGKSYGHNLAESVSVSTKSMTTITCEPGHIAAARARSSALLRWMALWIAAALFCGGEAALAVTLQEAEARQAEAKGAGAAQLSPRQFERGTEALEKARETQNAEQRADAADRAMQAFDAALANSGTARETLGTSLASREAADKAGAPRAAADDWERAEKLLDEALSAVERDNLEKATDRGDRATELYEAAELTALKTRYLGDARNAIAEAEQAKAEKFAPRSLAGATARLDKATARLEEDRSATGDATTLAQAAVYQARLAIYITQQAQRVREKEATVEDLLLDSQARMARLAEAAGTSADFSAGADTAAAEIQAELERLKALESDLEQARLQVAGLEEEIRELDKKLGNTSAERRNLMRVVQANLRSREQFEQVQALFSKNEAEALRNGDDVIVRLVGLRFPSGSARLDSTARSLLNRLQTAIDIYPRCKVRVEGHTDSSGSPGANQSLSQKRATAVADHLVEINAIQPLRITAAGYGDSRPVTNNRTAEGRARNRRIDVVIITKPKDNF